MRLLEDDILYFKRGEKENPKFTSRLGIGTEDFKGCRILDIGCGHGSMCVYMAERGAKRVIGIDIDTDRINFASENLKQNYPHLADVCSYYPCNLLDLEEGDFDIIVSKDSFEHIIDLDQCMAEIVKRLKPGGVLYLGFGPLYWEPYGDHRRTKARIPWGHVIIPEKILLERLRKSGKDVQSVYDLGLNKYYVSDYENLFKSSGLQVEYLRLNVGKNPVLRIFELISRFKPLRDYFAHNMYCILKRPE